MSQMLALKDREQPVIESPQPHYITVLANLDQRLLTQDFDQESAREFARDLLHAKS